ncbi:kelch-like protein 8 [Camellia sinensis]|uniref:kelch-like protein 8 n=1 Tax=Camellia sinensis TaxID=4442 RepID=UPI0010359BED|nr:kelch-like protein 8 [Camellia sinensis]
MGSLPSPPPSTPPRSPETSLSHNRVYALFCFKEPGPNSNISNWLDCYNPVDNTWTHVTPIPGLIENHLLKDFAMISIGESIYIIGGRLCRKDRAPATTESDEFFEVNQEVLSSVLRYDVNTDQWSKCAPLNTPRGTNHAGKCQESIYIIGGRLCRKDRAPATNESDEFFEVNQEVLSSVLRYDVNTDQWSKCAPLNTPRYDFACTVCNDKVYVAGGQTTLASARGVSSAEVYDPSLNEWTPLPNMNTLRYKCVGVTWQGKIHMIGGFVESGNFVGGYVDRSSAEVYDEERGKWDLVPGMWQLDVPPNQIVAVNGTLLSSGDCLNAWKGHIEAYDGKLNIWYMVEGSQLQIPSSPTSTSYGGEERWPKIQRRYLTMATIGTHLCLLAGYRNIEESSLSKSRVHVLDTSATGGTWRCLEPTEEEGEKELCSHCCVVQFP